MYWISEEGSGLGIALLDGCKVVPAGLDKKHSGILLPQDMVQGLVHV